MSRDIIDDVVLSNKMRNEELFNKEADSPIYFGSVRTKLGNQTKLDSIKNRNKIGKLRLICDIEESVSNFKLDTGKAKISLVQDGVITSDIEVHPILIKLIKVCVACSYTPNEDYSIVVSSFIQELIKTSRSINLPLVLPHENKTQKLVAEELNDYLKELLIENDIPYKEMVEVKPSKPSKKNKSLLEVAKLGDPTYVGGEIDV